MTEFCSVGAMRQDVGPQSRRYSGHIFHEPIRTPQGLGVRQPPGAFGLASAVQSGRGLPRSKTLSRRRMLAAVRCLEACANMKGGFL